MKGLRGDAPKSKRHYLKNPRYFANVCGEGENTYGICLTDCRQQTAYFYWQKESLLARLCQGCFAPLRGSGLERGRAAELESQPREVSGFMAGPRAGLVLQNEKTYSWGIISSPDIVSVTFWAISNSLFLNVILRCPIPIKKLTFIPALFIMKLMPC